MAEKKQYNVLVLGISGAGKSTWINALANYFVFDSLEEAVQSDPICVIPQCFQSIDNNFVLHTIRVGDHSQINKPNDASTSKLPQVYSFVHKNYCINFIDTPGVVDSCGYDTDERHVKSILGAISAFDELHGICILVKPNEAKLTHSYEYCLNELMKTLHKDAATNVVFIITNARSNNFFTGNARALLKAYLDKLKAKNNITIPLIKDTMYCVDNETFRYQCIYAQNPDLLKGIDIENYAKSWNKSFAEARRLLKTIRGLKPYATNKCIPVNESREIVMFLIPPLTAVNTIIQQDITNVKNNFETTVDSLQQQLEIDESTIEVTPLNYPRLVCTAEKCIGVVKEHGYQTYYKQICHDHHYLRNIPLFSFPVEGLKYAENFKNNGATCIHCGCDYKVHMHIDCDQKLVRKQSKLHDKMKEIRIKTREIAVHDLFLLMLNLRLEEKIVYECLEVFIAFLRQNAFYKYNSLYADCLASSIRIRETDDTQSQSTIENQTILDQIRKKLENFNFITSKIDEIGRDSKIKAVLNLGDVLKARDDLFSLEYYGAKIKEQYDEVKVSRSRQKMEIHTHEIRIDVFANGMKIEHHVSGKMMLPHGSEHLASKFNRFEGWPNVEIIKTKLVVEPWVLIEPEIDCPTGFVNMTGAEESNPPNNCGYFQISCPLSCTIDVRKWICSVCGNFVKLDTESTFLLLCSCGSKPYREALLTCLHPNHEESVKIDLLPGNLKILVKQLKKHVGRHCQISDQIIRNAIKTIVNSHQTANLELIMAQLKGLTILDGDTRRLLDRF